MFRTLRERWMAKTPAFFKTIVKSGVGVGAFGLSCIPFSGYLPAHLQPVPGYMIAIGAAAAGVAKLTKQDDPQVTQKVDSFMGKGPSPKE